MQVLIARPRFTRPVRDEEVRRVLDEVLPLYQRSGGLRALYAVRVSDREVANISFWDSREDAERGFAGAAPHMRAKYGGLLEGSPDRMFGELLYAHPAELSVARPKPKPRRAARTLTRLGDDLDRLRDRYGHREQDEGEPRGRQ
jgi:heme-degrading monooxygenase HmoA